MIKTNQTKTIEIIIKIEIEIEIMMNNIIIIIIKEFLLIKNMLKKILKLKKRRMSY